MTENAMPLAQVEPGTGLNAGAGIAPGSVRLLFLSREPVTRERNGSTAAVHSLLKLLCAHGAAVTVLVTTGASRSPRLFFRTVFPLPAGCELRVPGYLRLGGWYVRPWAVRPWLRLAVRVLRRARHAGALGRWIEAAAGERLFANSWDLTEPTAAESAMTRRAVEKLQPATVLANYAFWGALLRPLQGVHRAILMHDLLSDHVRHFHGSSLPLDCPEISPEQEFHWLDAADTVIAIQQAEAERVRPQVHGTVLLQPMALQAREAPAPETGRVLFVGSNSTPNLQGLQWLLEDVWPAVVRALPDAVLAVAGTVRDRWTGPVPRGVVLLGPVPSLEQEYRRAAVCLVPLRVGSGLKIKLMEALSYGRAIVSTSVGVQGVEDAVHGAVAVEDEPARFAEAVVRLLHDEPLRRLREQSATAAVHEHFSPGSAAETALLERLRGTAAATAT